MTCLPEAYRWLSVMTAARKFLRRPGLLLLQDGCFVVCLDPFPDQDALKDYLAWVNGRQLAIPWLSGLLLRMEIAGKLAAQTVPPVQWRKSLSASTWWETLVSWRHNLLVGGEGRILHRH